MNTLVQSCHLDTIPKLLTKEGFLFIRIVVLRMLKTGIHVIQAVLQISSEFV